MKTKILFIVHEASLTGAPLVAWRLAEYLNREFEVAMVYMSKGKLLETKQHTSKVYFFLQNKFTMRQRIAKRFFRIDPTLSYIGRKEINVFNTDIMFVNSIASIPFLFQSQLKYKNNIIYIHEMPLAILRYFKTMGYKLELFNEIGFCKFFVVNAIIKDFLIKEVGVSEEKVMIIEPSIDDHFFLRKDQAQSKAKYDIILSGQGGWTKGTDLVPQLAFHLEKADPQRFLKIAWIGDVEKIIIDQIFYELQLSGITRVEVAFLGVQSDIASVIDNSKIFLSLSRAEAMQTAAIEAMAMGKPIICFKDSGGIASIISNNCGFVEDYPDMKSIAERTLLLLTEDKKYKEFSVASFDCANYFSIANKGKDFAKSINSLLRAVRN
jgi:glycosyltransferase involved in cell wall biosynthesis